MPQESPESITATELARNVSSSIDRVRITRKSLHVTKGSQTVAELCPPPKRGLPIEQLPNLLASLPKLGDDSKAFERDLAKARSKAAFPEPAWD